ARWASAGSAPARPPGPPPTPLPAHPRRSERSTPRRPPPRKEPTLVRVVLSYRVRRARPGHSRSGQPRPTLSSRPELSPFCPTLAPEHPPEARAGVSTGGAVLEGTLERITYANEETGYTIARLATARSSDLLTIVGALGGAQVGESL